MKLSKTHRGFALSEFHDLYGEKCSIQKSSLTSEDAIWLGVDNPIPKILRKDGKGWQPIALPKDGEILISGRMHLNQKQVKKLLPHLTKFAQTGEL